MERADPSSWDRFSTDYDNTVYSVTRFALRRKNILDAICPSLVLNMGCGSTAHLNRALRSCGHRVVATDFCEAMLEESRRSFADEHVEHRLADSRDLPFADNTFDSVVSVNSILPPNRAHVQEMFNETYRVLVPGGRLVAFLPSFDSAVRLVHRLGFALQLDHDERRCYDTTGWQCFHTADTVAANLVGAGYRLFFHKNVFFRSHEEIAELKRLYGVDTSTCWVYEHFVVGVK